MQAAPIAMIPPASPVPVQSSVATKQASSASGLPAFAQMVVQNVSASNSGRSSNPGVSNASKTTSSVATANSPANTSGNKGAPRSAGPSGSPRSNSLLDVLAREIPTLSPMVPQQIEAQASAPSVPTATVGACGTLPIADSAAVGIAPGLNKTTDISNVAGPGTAQHPATPIEASNALASGAASHVFVRASATPSQVDANASEAVNSLAATSAGNDPAATVSTQGGANTPVTPPPAPSTVPANQEVTPNQASTVASEASAPVLANQGDPATNSTSSSPTYVEQDVVAKQSLETSRNPQALAPVRQAAPASDAANLATPPVVQDAAAHEAPLPTVAPQAPAPPNQNSPASKVQSPAPARSHAEAATSQVVKNSVAAFQPQLPAVGDILRQVAAVAGKANAQAAQVSVKAIKDSLNGPVKGTPVDQADAAMTDLQPTALRPTSVGSHQAGADASSMPKGNGAGTGSSANQHEQESTAAPAPDAKGNSTTPGVSLNDAPVVAHQSAAVGNSNLQGSAATPATPCVAKDDTPAQKAAAPDPSRSDATANSALDKQDLDSTASRVISRAQLGGNDAHSEMHIAMQADKLGAVELHARVTGEQVGAAITVEKKEAHAALAVELPTLQQALAEKNLRVANVVLLHGALHSTSDGASDSTQQQPRSHPGVAYRQPQPEAPLPPVFAAATEPNGVFDDRGRLNVHA